MSGKRVFYTATTSLAVIGLLASIFLGNVFACGKTIYPAGVFAGALHHRELCRRVEGKQLIDGAIIGMLELGQHLS
jgi:hypothetical protein